LESADDRTWICISLGGVDRKAFNERRWAYTEQSLGEFADRRASKAPLTGVLFIRQSE